MGLPYFHPNILLTTQRYTNYSSGKAPGTSTGFDLHIFADIQRVQWCHRGFAFPQWGLGDFMMLGQVVIFLLLICPRQKGFITTTGRQTLFPYMLHHPLMPSAILEVELMDVFQKWIWCRGCWGSRGPFVLFFFQHKQRIFVSTLI